MFVIPFPLDHPGVAHLGVLLAVQFELVFPEKSSSLVQNGRRFPKMRTSVLQIKRGDDRGENVLTFIVPFRRLRNNTDRRKQPLSVAKALQLGRRRLGSLRRQENLRRGSIEGMIHMTTISERRNRMGWFSNISPQRVSQLIQVAEEFEE